MTAGLDALLLAMTLRRLGVRLQEMTLDLDSLLQEVQGTSRTQYAATRTSV